MCLIKLDRVKVNCCVQIKLKYFKQIFADNRRLLISMVLHKIGMK